MTRPSTGLDYSSTQRHDPAWPAREWFDVTLPRMELDWTVSVDEALGTLVMVWKPGLAPMWDLVSYLPDYRIHARLSVEDNLMAEVTVRRWE